MLTEAEILTDVIQPHQGNISPGVAQEILNLRYSDQTQSRIRALLSNNNAGTIDPNDRADLEKYLRVGQFIDLIQAKASLSLAEHGNGAP